MLPKIGELVRRMLILRQPHCTRLMIYVVSVDSLKCAQYNVQFVTPAMVLIWCVMGFKTDSGKLCHYKAAAPIGSALQISYNTLLNLKF